MPPPVDWPVAIKPLLKKYRKQKHPLEYGNLYQLIVMVILSAQDSDRHINSLAPALFKAFPNMKTLSRATAASLKIYIGKVRKSADKANWLIEIAKEVRDDKNIPLTQAGLTGLKGIGRKSANVILREAGRPAEGVIVDLHVLRVAPRLGIAKGSNANKIEEQIMEVLPKRQWDAGMAMSFHGREICRPQPKCEICFMRNVCEYYRSLVKS